MPAYVVAMRCGRAAVTVGLGEIVARGRNEFHAAEWARASGGLVPERVHYTTRQSEPGAQASRDLAHGNSSGIPERVPWIVAQFVNPNGSAHRPAHIDWIVLGRRRHRKKVCPNQFVALATSGPSPIGRGSARTVRRRTRSTSTLVISPTCSPGQLVSCAARTSGRSAGWSRSDPSASAGAASARVPSLSADPASSPAPPRPRPGARRAPRCPGTCASRSGCR